MRILNFGSLNIDHVYSVDHFVRPGETISSRNYRKFAGGKGFNQSLALARAGAAVTHAGKIGEDGVWMRDILSEAGVDVSLLETTKDAPTGHGMIQVNPAGENCIVLNLGANLTVTESDARRVLENYSKGDTLLLQNEITALPEIISLGSAKGMRIVFNPAPMTAEVASYPLELIDYFVVNEIEAEQLTGLSDPDAMLAMMRKKYPKAGIVLTLGAQGVRYADDETTLSVDAESITAIDSTAAGDTFIGFWLAELLATDDMEVALRLGCKAAAICVTRMGAADSIPTRTEIE